MGKLHNKGRQRRDKYYFRAKESGYRARSAFKLLQLNQKYEFFQKSRVCIDLCAAPGSWMQIATKFMPVSSVIIGIDRVPIKPIPNTIAIQGDITTSKVKSDIKSHLKTWKADLVLHDGSPNVGQNWIADAYQQNILVLHAFKLACGFLRKGGCFVSKVFRSKDYFSLEYIFRKLFKNVDATKPHASRTESAEIFVVCRGYLAPDKVDSQFFEAKYVFQEVDAEPANRINLQRPSKVSKKADGYEEGVTMLYKEVSVSHFIETEDFYDILQTASEDEVEVKIVEENEGINKALIEKTPEELEMEELEKLHEEIQTLKTEKIKMDKSALKKAKAKKKKLEDRMKMKMLVAGDAGPIETASDGLFQLSSLDRVKNLSSVVDTPIESLGNVSDDENNDIVLPKKKTVRYNVNNNYLLEGDDTALSSDSEESDSDIEGLMFDSPEEPVKKKVRFAENVEEQDEMEGVHENPIITDLQGNSKKDQRIRRAESFFHQEIFNDLETEIDEDYDLSIAEKKLKKEEVLAGKKPPKKKENEEEEGFTAKDAPSDNSDSSSSDSDYESEEEKKEAQKLSKKKKKKNKGLDAVGLALAAKMIHSKKTKRDIVDDAWNRFMFDDTELPSWFMNDEKKHNRRRIEVDPEDLRYYRDRGKPVNARTIKKVVEAKARKQRRVKKRLAKVRKKAEVIGDSSIMSEREKAEEMQKLYKKALAPLKKNDKKYVLMRKRFGGRKPRSVQGPYKMVDKRLKKDKRAAQKKTTPRNIHKK